MAKKYLSLKEAAKRLAMSESALAELRESGGIRGYADQGSWKFLESAVKELVRSRQPDSSPDIPLAGTDDTDEDIVKKSTGDSDSDVRLPSQASLFDDDDDDDLSSSDSDVRLAGDSGPLLEAADSSAANMSILDFDSDEALTDSDSDVKIVDPGTDPDIDLAEVMGKGDDHDLQTDADIDLSSTLFEDFDSSDRDDSDSDVRMTGPADTDPGSDIVLSDSDSDIRLSGDDDEDSDSDVHLVDTPSSATIADQSESDVKLSTGETDSDIRLKDIDRSDSNVQLSAGTDSDINLVDDELAADSLELPDDSDLKLIDPSAKGVPDSGITLETAPMDDDDSGISLEIDDSGISLEADDSGIALEALDSGFGDDSGITLDVPDSGIAIMADDSGISLEADMGATMPMQAVPGAADDLADTGAQTMQMGAAALGAAAGKVVGAETSDFDISRLEGDEEDDGTDTSILMFDEEGESGGGVAVEDDLEDDDFGDEDFSGEDFGDEFDDDEMDDVFDAEEEEEDEFATGESQVGSGFVAPAAGRGAVEAPWTGWTTAALSIGTVLSLLSAFAGLELVRTMWMWFQPGTEGSGFLSLIGSLFAS